MTTPNWITFAGSLGSIKNQTQVEINLNAQNSIAYTLVSGALPPGLALTAQGVIVGTVDLPTITSTFEVYTFTVQATAADTSSTLRNFSLTVLFDFYVNTENRIERVRYSGPVFEYTIFRGQAQSSQNIIWRIGAATVPSFINVSAAGTITSNFYTDALPLRREQFLIDQNTTSASASLNAWNIWLASFLSTRKEYDYQFTVELSNGQDAIQQSYTVRIIYTKISTTESWFANNINNTTVDPEQYYFFFTISESNFINWISSSNLGEVDNGAVSELAVKAATLTNAKLAYKLKPAYASTIPQGIQLLDPGFISGRFSFKCYQDDPITVPANDLYNFTVRATTEDQFNFSEKTFTLKIKRAHDKPYDNIWVRAFPNSTAREQLVNIINNEELFPSDLIYRLEDPWFGKTNYAMRFLFAAGLNSKPMSEYEKAVADITARKIITVSQVKTAVCYDANGNIKYEVVYVEAQENTSLSTYTPKTLYEMRQQLEQYIGSYAPSVLPEWMSNPQSAPNNPGTFIAPLGFINAIVLAYTVPGASELIKYRINTRNINFNFYPFEFDRYELDNAPGDLYDRELEEYATGAVTIFDNNTTVFEQGGTRFIDTGELPVDLESGSKFGDKYIKFPLNGVAL